MSDQALKKSARELLQSVCEDRRMRVDLLKRVVGQYITDEFDSNAYFSSLKKEF